MESFITQFLGFLSRHLGLPFWILLFLLLAIALIVLVWQLWFRTKPAQPEGETMGSSTLSGDGGKSRKAMPLGLKQSFRRACSTLRKNVAGRNYLYEIPWYLMIGEAGSGKTTALANSGLNLPMGRPVESETGQRPPVSWWFYDRGVVLDVAGSMILEQEGRSGDEKSWEDVVTALGEFRTRRPLDGIVLSIPASDLIGPNMEPPDVIATKAEQIYERLWTLQKKLGFTLPVYVLVTKSDEIPGFASFASALPEHARDEIFGWSVPYGPETAYSPGWADEAFGHMGRVLLQNQLEVFAEGGTLRDAEAVFEFPSSFEELHEPLRLYLNHIFKPSVYHDSFRMRGLYFTGDTEATADLSTYPGNVHQFDSALGGGGDAGLAAWQTSETGPRPVFLKHLLDNKVFAESSLAQPAGGRIRSQTRSVFRAQVACAAVLVLGLLGITFSTFDLNTDREALGPLFASKYVSLNQMSEMDRHGEKPSRPFLRKASEEIIDGMSQVRHAHPVYAFLPSSWFSPLGDKVLLALEFAYDTVIIKAMRTELLARTQGLVIQPLQLTAEKPGDPTATTYGSDTTPELELLTAYVDELVRLESMIQGYNRLRQGGDVSNIGKIFQYLYDFEIPERFFPLAARYQRDLDPNNFLIVDIEQYSGTAQARLFELAERALDSLRDGRVIFRNAPLVAAGIDALAYERGDPAEVAARLRELAVMIQELKAELGSAGLLASLSRSTVVGNMLGDILVDVETSEFFGPEARKQIDRMAGESAEQARDRLYTTRSAIVGPIVIVDQATGAPAVAEPVARLGQALEDLMTQRFMLKSSGAVPKLVAGNSAVFWDRPLLEAALSMLDSHENYLNTSRSRYPGELISVVERATTRQLEISVLDLLAAAQQTETVLASVGTLDPEGQLRREVADFRAAAPALLRILDRFSRLNTVAGERLVLRLVRDQADDLIQEVDTTLEGDALYQPRGGGFGWWDGIEPPAFEGFDARDDAEIAAYLDAQRSRIAFLAQDYARPLVAVLSSPALNQGRSENRIAIRWRRILEALDSYDRRTTGNSVSNLEDFIRFTLTGLTGEDCLLQAGQDADAGRSADYFDRRRRELLSDLLARCQLIASDTVLASYGQIAAFFNERLAGRFPFGTLATGPGDAEALPEDIRDFFRLLEDYQLTGMDLLRRSERFGLSRDRVLSFLDTMVAARAFFDPYLTSADGALPTFDIGTEFRVNRRREVAGNQIIEWRLGVGEQVATLRGESKTLRWRYGDPVGVVLRWAKDAPNTPFVKPGEPAMTVDRGAVAYVYQNKWSLLSLLQDQASTSEDFARLSDPDPHSLRFDVPTARVGGGPGLSPVTPEPARVYIRVRVAAPSDEGRLVERLRLPAQLPVRAPQLEMGRKLAGLEQRTQKTR
ncbi:MAG: type VI secretion protein IcmF/TssM N-terminal domain-containing protein [Rhodospirillales bacterium]